MALLYQWIYLSKPATILQSLELYKTILKNRFGKWCIHACLQTPMGSIFGQCLQRLEKSPKYPKTGVRDHCTPPDMSLRTELGTSAITVSALKHWTISPASKQS